MAIGDAGYYIYGQSSVQGEIDAIPRNKYSFTVSLNYAGSPRPLDLTRIANIQMPTFTYRTQTLNKYNAKNIVQTGIDYTPITLTAYDTKDHYFEDFLKDYARYYFAGPMNEEDYASWLQSPKGLELPNSRNFITTLKIIRKDTANRSNTIEIFNPYITNVDTDTLDYADSSASVFRVSFSYEGYNIISDGTSPPPPFIDDTATPDAGFQDEDPFEEGNEDNYEVHQDAEEFTTALVPPAKGTHKPVVKTNKPQLERWDGTLKKGEKIRNIDGVSYKVPAPANGPS